MKKIFSENLFKNKLKLDFKLSKKMIFFTIFIFTIIAIFLLTFFAFKRKEYPWVPLYVFENKIREAFLFDNNPKFEEISYFANLDKLVFKIEKTYYQTTVSKELFNIFLSKKMFSEEEIKLLHEKGAIVNPDLTFLGAISLDSLALKNDQASLKEPANYFSFLDFLKKILPQIFVWSFVVFLMSLLLHSFFNKNKNSKNLLIQDVKNSKTFADIAGNKQAIQELKEIVDYQLNPQKYYQIGARIPKGILFEGPPGTGKTLLAKVLASELKINFLATSGSSFVEMYAGLGAKKIRNLFSQARKLENAVIFIDEIDSLAKSRNANPFKSNDEREQTLNQLLVEMDGILEDKSIVVIGATNRIETLDSALLRPGRFDRIINIQLPDLAEREEILFLHGKNKRFSPEISFAEIAKKTDGFSGAQLENILNEATLLAYRKNENYISNYEIDEAISRVKFGISNTNIVLNSHEKKIIATHEAGHAVTAFFVDSDFKIEKISIESKKDVGGYNLYFSPNSNLMITKEEVEKNICILLGGRAAEELIYGKQKVSSGIENDLEKAYQLVKKMIFNWGMADEGFLFLDKNSQTNENKYEHQVNKIIAFLYKKTLNILEQNLEVIKILSEALIIKETIFFEEIYYIFTQKKIPQSISKLIEEVPILV